MLSVTFGENSAYEGFVIESFKSICPNPFDCPKEPLNIITEFYYLDFSQTGILTKDCYFGFDPKSQQPSCMLHPRLLFVKLMVTSITE